MMLRLSAVLLKVTTAPEYFRVSKP
jgi:hypothetical protein